MAKIMIMKKQLSLKLHVTTTKQRTNYDTVQI